MRGGGLISREVATRSDTGGGHPSTMGNVAVESREIGDDQMETWGVENNSGGVDPMEYLERLEQQGIRVVTVWDEEYPPLLKETKDAPYVLFVRGRIEPADQIAVAMVGTRRPTSYGREVAEKLAGELASYGVTVVSGLAYGVDAISQAAALGGGGRTIAVLGNGIDQIQPAANRKLGEKIIASGRGAVMSEYAPGVQGLRQTFPARNRIVSGMSLGVVVVEGTAKSGTLITAKFAQRQGRYLWAVPGPVNSVMSAAPNQLLKEGAIPVTGVEDILCKIPSIKHQASNNNKYQNSNDQNITDEERKIWELLTEEKSVDELVRESGLGTEVVLSSLTMMEIRGEVKTGGGKYRRG